MSQTYCHRTPFSLLLCASHTLPQSHDGFPFQVLGKLSLMGAHTVSKRIYQMPCPWHATCHSAQPNSPYQTAARSQACSATLERKQAREWILPVSVLQLKWDLKCCRTFQISECSLSWRWCVASPLDLWIAQSFAGDKNALMASTGL